MLLYSVKAFNFTLYMKSTLTLLFSLAALVFSIYAAFGPGHEKEEPAKSIFENRNAAKPEEKEIEIADLMLYIQHFHQKVYLAAKAGNTSLSKFYLDEMGEKMKEIADAAIWSNGVNISQNMRTYGLPQVDAMLKKTPEMIYRDFDNLTQGCNSCHVASKHANIKIKTPVDAAYPNQDFTP